MRFKLNSRNNIILKYFQVFPFCNLLRMNGKVYAKFSMEIELLRMLERQFNFSSNLVDGQDVWGAKVNNIWNGVVGQVYYGVSALQLYIYIFTSS